MTVRSIHRVIGILLALPLLGWALTGFLFFIKPGYAGAYETLQPRTYPIIDSITVPPRPDWLEVRVVRTVLGEHLVVRTADGWSNLDSRTFEPKPAPTAAELKQLVEDAIPPNSSRYGNIVKVVGVRAVTDTGIEVTLDWDRLTLEQRGRDTARIEWLYRIHYLQWTGAKSVDRIVGVAGLAGLTCLSVLGVWLFFSRRA